MVTGLMVAVGRMVVGVCLGIIVVGRAVLVVCVLGIGCDVVFKTVCFGELALWVWAMSPLSYFSA
jgi:hypothetical protein